MQQPGAKLRKMDFFTLRGETGERVAKDSSFGGVGHAQPPKTAKTQTVIISLFSEGSRPNSPRAGYPISKVNCDAVIPGEMVPNPLQLLGFETPSGERWILRQA